MLPVIAALSTQATLKLCITNSGDKRSRCPATQSIQQVCSTNRSSAGIKASLMLNAQCNCNNSIIYRRISIARSIHSDVRTNEIGRFCRRGTFRDYTRADVIGVRSSMLHKDCLDGVRTLWSKVNRLLLPSCASTESTHTVQDFNDFSVVKSMTPGMLRYL